MARLAHQINDFAEHFSRLEEFPRAQGRVVESQGQPLAYVFLGVPWELLFFPKRAIQPIPNAESGLRITDYRLRITDYGLPITDYGLRITDYRLRITDYALLHRSRAR